MNRNFKYYLSVWLIFFVLFNGVAFISPDEMAGMSKFGGAFWSGYIFITLAFIGQLGCSYIALKEENLQKLFYRIPLISISWTGLILTLVFGSLCMIIPNVPNWVGIIPCLAIFAFYAISVIRANLAGDIVSEIDDKVKSQMLFIKSLTVDVESLIARAKSDTVKNECKKVYEAVRYSDPMSNSKLASVESEITVRFENLKTSVLEDKIDAVHEIANELIILIDDRNKKCKLFK